MAMNHLYRFRPSFQAIVDKQRIAQHRLQSETTRTEPERSHYRRVLEPVSLADVEIPKLPLVRAKADDPASYVLLGELAQTPGRVILIDATTGQVRLDYAADQLELIPPT